MSSLIQNLSTDMTNKADSIQQTPKSPKIKLIDSAATEKINEILDNHVNLVTPDELASTSIQEAELFKIKTSGAGHVVVAEPVTAEDIEKLGLSTPDASEIEYSNSTSGLTATTVQSAIDELKTELNTKGDGSSGGGATQANELSYNNTNSQLQATNVQSAIDELKTKVDNKKDADAVDDIDAADVTIDLTETTLTSTNVHDAIVELKTELDTKGTGNLTEVNAEDVNFDNASNGFTSTNVQDAIEEVKNSMPLPGVTAAKDLTFDNSENGFTATDTQSAIEELKAAIEAGGGEGGSTSADAADINFNNQGTTLEAVTVQNAITEVYGIASKEVSAEEVIFDNSKAEYTNGDNVQQVLEDVATMLLRSTIVIEEAGVDEDTDTPLYSIKDTTLRAKDINYDESTGLIDAETVQEALDYLAQNVGGGHVMTTKEEYDTIEGKDTDGIIYFIK